MKNLKLQARLRARRLPLKTSAADRFGFVQRRDPICPSVTVPYLSVWRKLGCDIGVLFDAAATCDAPNVVRSPRRGSTNAAFTNAGLLFQHLRTPTYIPPPNYVPRPLPLQLRYSLSYVGYSSSSTDLHISDLIT
ncbi:jg7371 [Pararge aegeria aegeria]|uniref:Jg7371 protein n=1 Tax=Pararge aegeria aegeria TaxID=348720 RepID=A0A8S4RIM3_9NEOP|nr:jg7371 [Pararge aegeria aegeria]